MRYDEFRNALVQAIFEARLRFLGRFTETIDIATTSRRFEGFLEATTPQGAEPFHASASVAFKWDPSESARTYTQEEDLLSHLFGRDSLDYTCWPYRTACEADEFRATRTRVSLALSQGPSHSIALPAPRL